MPQPNIDQKTREQLESLIREICARLPEDTAFVMVTFSGVKRRPDRETWGACPSLFFANAGQSVDSLLSAAASQIIGTMAGETEIASSAIEDRPRKQ